MFNTKEIIKKTFDEAAPQFDEIGTPFFKYFGKALVDFAEIGNDDHILDIACGKGATTFPLLEKISDRGKIYAIDISPGMIAECRKQVQNSNGLNLNFSVMDAEQLEFTDESMDKVICGFGLFFLPDIEKGMSEIRRVLKPGGYLVFSSWNDDSKLQYLEEIILKYLPERANNRPVDNGKIHHTDFDTINGILKVLEKSGFKKQQTEIQNFDCFYANEEEWIKSRWQTAFRMYFEQLSKVEYRDFKKEIFENLREYRVGGKIKIPMSAILTKATK